MMSLLWIILPYSAFLSFALGQWWRYRHDRFSWYADGTEIDQGQRFGATALRAGVGVMFTARVTELLASGPHSHPDGAGYTAISIVQMCALATAALGAVLLFVPDIIGSPARPSVNTLDRFTFPLMVAALLSWVAIKFDPNSSEGGYRTAETLFAWFRSLFSLHPDPDVMVHAPVIYQTRGLILLVFVAIWPYTRLAGFVTDPICRQFLRLGSQSRHLAPSMRTGLHNALHPTR